MVEVGEDVRVTTRSRIRRRCASGGYGESFVGYQVRGIPKCVPRRGEDLGRSEDRREA